jgi:hypothetical protein
MGTGIDGILRVSHIICCVIDLNDLVLVNAIVDKMDSILVLV